MKLTIAILRNRHLSLKLQDTFFWVLYGLTCVVILWSRGLGWSGIRESLWAEDASIFLNQAYAMGRVSLITSYQGYFHTYQRVVSLIAAISPLQWVPYVLFAFSCLTLVILAYVIRNRLKQLNIGQPALTMLPLLVILQTHGGEVIFSLTNT